MSRAKTILKKLAISLGSLVVMGLVLEVVTRALEPGPFALLDSRPYRKHEQLHHVHEPGFSGRWDGTWYEINELGLRGPEFAPGFVEGELRIAALGDSCTFGKGVREEDCWPRQLERQLTQLAGGAWRPYVANLGHNGYAGEDYLAILRARQDSVRPDVVLVGYNLNDFPNSAQAADAQVFRDRGLRKALPRGLRDFMGRFGIYRYARSWYYHLNRAQDWETSERVAREAGEGGLDSPIWRKQRRILEELIVAAGGEQARVAVFLFPYESQVYAESFEDAPIRQMEAICKELGVPFVDLAAEFRAYVEGAGEPAALFLRGDRYHPNPLGYGIVARAVMEVLQEQGWLPAP